MNTDRALHAAPEMGTYYFDRITRHYVLIVAGPISGPAAVCAETRDGTVCLPISDLDLGRSHRPTTAPPLPATDGPHSACLDGRLRIDEPQRCRACGEYVFYSYRWMSWVHAS
jgi:hypothetical protein